MSQKLTRIPLRHRLLKPFLANVPILCPLKTPENQRFSGVFRGYKMGKLARNELRNQCLKAFIIFFRYYKET